jgi:predicted TIM-barrel fold metal-dependent hydrolase
MKREMRLMVLDGHIHVFGDGPADAEGFARRLDEAGVDGGVLISSWPQSFRHTGQAGPPGQRLERLFEWAKAKPEIYPFYWIDPLEDDAPDQVTLAVERGVAGFKISCNRFTVRDPRALGVIRAIAAADKPILFHSGILFDGHDSAEYNRPGQFEALLEIDGLRFCLAHISWPWCDECLAVYGKFRAARRQRPDLSVEMFIDVAPGTPPIYRRDALTKLLTIGYEAERNLIFATDGGAEDYNVAHARAWIQRDNDIYGRLGIAHQTLEAIYSGNLRRFVGGTAHGPRRGRP